MLSNFRKLNYDASYNSLIARYGDLFIEEDELNIEIFRKYKSLLGQKGEIGVSTVKDSLCFGEWGIVLDKNYQFKEDIKNFGWFEEAKLHLLKNQSELFFMQDKHLFLKRESLNVAKIDKKAALLSFPGALTFGHWIVDIILRYQFLNDTRIMHKIETFIVPNALGVWSDIFFDFMNISPDEVTRLSNKDLVQVSELYIPTVASFLPGGLIPINIARHVFEKFRDFLQTKPKSVVPTQSKIAMLKHTPMTSSHERVGHLEPVEDYIKSIGGLVIDPLDFKLEDLCYLLKDVEIIVGQDSSALHNNAFIGKDLVVIETVARKNLLHLSIQHSLGRKIQYLECDREDDRYQLNLTKLKSVLKNYAA